MTAEPSAQAQRRGGKRSPQSGADGADGQLKLAGEFAEEAGEFFLEGIDAYSENNERIHDKRYYSEYI